MTYKLRVDQKPTYLHAIVTGLNSRENVMRYLEEVFRECSARGCFKVLIEECLEGPRLGMDDVFKIASEGSIKCGCMPMVIAYVDVYAKNDLMHLAATVAVNRWLQVAVFSTAVDAERWLLSEDRGSTEPHTAADG